MSELKSLIEISRFYGDDPAYVIAGGGNTSYKDTETIWIKASGIPLAGIDEHGFVSLSRAALGQIAGKTYSEDHVLREEEVKEDTKKAVIQPEHLRPSVETSLHDLIEYAYVIHTHPTLVNALMCSEHAATEVSARFGDDALYVEYTDPGYVLFKLVQQRINAYKEKHRRAPQIIFLQNHGVFVGANTVQEIKSLYTSIEARIREGKILEIPDWIAVEDDTEAGKMIARHVSKRNLVSKTVRCELIDHFTRDKDQLQRIAKPFSPDIIVYCKSSYLFLSNEMPQEEITDAVQDFETGKGYYPKVILQVGGGLTLVEEDVRSLQTVQDVFMDLMKISYLSEQFGGPHFMTPEQIQFIDNWEVEHYRRKVAKG